MKHFCYLLLFANDLRSDQLTSLIHISSFRIECNQRLIIDEWFGLFEHMIQEFAQRFFFSVFFFLFFVSSFASHFVFEHKESSFEGPNDKSNQMLCIQYVNLVCMKPSVDKFQSRIRIHDTANASLKKNPIDLSRISRNDKFCQECDSRKMPCNWTISKALTKSSRK